MLSLEERFWIRVRKTKHCWIWIGARDSDGYGRFKLRYGKYQTGDKTIGAHRLSWKIHHGPIPKGLQVCHTCDNPSCVRPDHLFLGTSLDNYLDFVSKGLDRNYQKGEDHGQSKLTEKNVRYIRRCYRKRHPIYGFSALARRFKVDPVAVRLAAIGKTWKCIRSNS